MQFGLPVVATNIGGPAEVIPQERCLCEPENPVDLAETIEDIYPDRNELGEQNRQCVNEHYSPEVVVPQIIELYEQVSKCG
jgi:glycosyltransferase involved in cell wall biosynthesis